MPPDFTETMQKSNEVSSGSFRDKNLNLMAPVLSYGTPIMHQLKNSYFWSTAYTSYPYDRSIYSGNSGLYYPTLGCTQVPMHMQMFPRGYLNDQKFHYFVVVDFEATCDKEKNPHPQEIIEFPSVLVNGTTGQLEDCFQVYVRPTYNKKLTEFCKDLTGIDQSKVDEGVLLSDALLMHDKWLEDKGIKFTNFAIVTWSNWDCRVMLESECRFKKIRKPSYFDRWINLKVPFGEVYGWSRYTNLKEAVELAGLKWAGRAHSGLDDAKNTARLLTHLMHRGTHLTITNSLIWQSGDHPHPLHHQTPSPPEYGFPYQPYPSRAMVQPARLAKPVEDSLLRCFCGTNSIKFLKPAPKGGTLFYFGCGNWTPNGGARCSFVVPSSEGTQIG